MAFQFTDDNFKEIALDKKGVSVVDFWAEWCGPCRMITPIIEELSGEYDGKATIGKLNVDHNPNVSMKYGVRSIPTILILKDGEVVDKHVGVTTKAALQQKIDAHLEPVAVSEGEAAPVEVPENPTYEFTDDNFQEASSTGVSVVDFWAEWCGPCRMITPIVEKLAGEFYGKATIGKLNVDHNPNVSMKYGVRSIPTILILKDGEVVDKHVGVTTETALKQKIEAHL